MIKDQEFFSPHVEKDSFAKKKAKVDDFLKREAKNEVGLGGFENEGKLDENIKEITIKMNQLPFLYTIQTCGGHMHTRETIKDKYSYTDKKFLQLPPVNTAFYQSGYIGFETTKDTQSQSFIDKLKNLVSQFKGATLFDPTTETEPERQELPYDLKFGEGGSIRGIDIQKAKALELKREKFKEELGKLIDAFLQTYDENILT